MSRRRRTTLDGAGVPAHLLTGTKNLFRHMILQNAGVYRRRGDRNAWSPAAWTEPVARALGSLLRIEQDEAWLRIRARVRSWLPAETRCIRSKRISRDACEHAYQNLEPDETPDDELPPRAHVTEMHASLFAVGDCFGVAGAEERAQRRARKLRPILTDLANMEGDRADGSCGGPARAAAYLLTVTAQPRVGGKKDLSQELLEKLSHHPDAVTARLSQWALSFRFAPDGSIRPFLASADAGA